MGSGRHSLTPSPPFFLGMVMAYSSALAHSCSLHPCVLGSEKVGGVQTMREALPRPRQCLQGAVQRAEAELGMLART